MNDWLIVRRTDTVDQLYYVFCFVLNVPVNSFGHVGMVSSPNHTLSWTNLTKRLTGTSITYFPV